MLDFLSINRYREFSVGSPAIKPESYEISNILTAGPERWSKKFRVFKFCTDKFSALVALPLIAVIGLILLCINPIYNRGPLFFKQERAGLHGKRFKMWKFRSMSPVAGSVRDPNAPVETDRITRLGKFMRKTRIDELPNFFNVLKGDMSLIGPRPDAASHADLFGARVLGYAERHRVRPGITGLAQVEMGYAEGEDDTACKAKYDNMYVSRSCGRLDFYIIRRTIGVMMSGAGR